MRDAGGGMDAAVPCARFADGGAASAGARSSGGASGPDIAAPEQSSSVPDRNTGIGLPALRYHEGTG
eukprot:9942257-Alexandrium_andersonii.AAC.1